MPGSTAVTSNWLPNALPRPAFPDEHRLQFADSFSLIHNRHTFKFGIDESGYKNYTRQGGQALTGVTITPLGGFTFNGQWTANHCCPN